MRLKDIQLLCQVKAPWQTNYYDSLENKPGYEFRVIDGFLHIQKDGKSLMVIHASMVRCASVVDEAPPVPAKHDEWPHPDAPKNMIRGEIVVTADAPVAPPKRRGRPPKNRV